MRNFCLYYQGRQIADGPGYGTFVQDEKLIDARSAEAAIERLKDLMPWAELFSVVVLFSE